MALFPLFHKTLATKNETILYVDQNLPDTCWLAILNPFFFLIHKNGLSHYQTKLQLCHLIFRIQRLYIFFLKTFVHHQKCLLHQTFVTEISITSKISYTSEISISSTICGSKSQTKIDFIRKIYPVISLQIRHPFAIF